MSSEGKRFDLTIVPQDSILDDIATEVALASSASLSRTQRIKARKAAGRTLSKLTTPSQTIAFCTLSSEMTQRWVKSISAAIASARARESRVQRKSRVTMFPTKRSSIEKGIVRPRLSVHSEHDEVSSSKHTSEDIDHENEISFSESQLLGVSGEIGELKSISTSQTLDRRIHFLTPLREDKAVNVRPGSSDPSGRYSVFASETQDLFMKSSSFARTRAMNGGLPYTGSRKIFLSPFKQAVLERIFLIEASCNKDATMFHGLCRNSTELCLERLESLLNKYGFNIEDSEAHHGKPKDSVPETKDSARDITYVEAISPENNSGSDGDEEMPDSDDPSTLMSTEITEKIMVYYLSPTSSSISTEEASPEKFSQSIGKALFHIEDLKRIVSELCQEDSCFRPCFSSVRYASITLTHVFKGADLAAWMLTKCKSMKISSASGVVLVCNCMIYYNLIADSTALQNAAAFDEEKIYRITLSSNYEDLISYALSSKLLTSIPFRHNDFWIPFLLSGPRKIDLKPTKKGSRTISDAFHGSSLISWFLCENFVRYETG